MASISLGGGSARGGHGIGGKRAAQTRFILAALLTPASLGVLSLAMPAVAQVRAESVSFDIPSQPVNEALLTFARQAGVRLVMADAQFGNARSNPVKGAYDRESALAALLRGTGVAARLENGAIVLQRSADVSRAAPVQLAQADPPGTRTTDVTPAGRSPGGTDDEADRVVVVGTNIKGVYPASSPIEVYTSEDIARSATTTEQFIQKLPQNFGTRAQYATGAQANSQWNQDGVNGVDLRGLGIGTTLVLVNGRRLGLSDVGRTADVSLIPASAIERVEVLTDGASAIYGSDAIGGVVNFVLRDDFEGAETRASYGGVTSGSLRQGDLGLTFGSRWNGGHGLVSYNGFSASALDVADRDYAAAMQRGALTPHDMRHNLLATFSQDLSARLQVSGDLVYALRDVKTENNTINPTIPANNTLNIYTSETEQVFANLAVDYEFADSLTASLNATYSDVDVDGRAINFGYNRAPPTLATFPAGKNHTALDITAKVDGSLFALPGGAVRFSAGGGLRSEDYSGVSTGGVLISTKLGRDTTYAFAELFLPLVGEAQNIPLVRRLELSLAGRYTNYEDTSTPALNHDFGDATDPKVGLLWVPLESLSLRGTYGTSFRAPHLVQLDPASSSNILLNGPNIPFPSGPAATRLGLLGITPDLGPEKAETATFGFDFRPSVLPGFDLSATYYKIDYTDRIGAAPLGVGTAFLQTPALFPDAIYRAPSAAFIEQVLRTTPTTVNTTGISVADPAAAAATLFGLPNLWIQDLRLKNLALSKQDGMDLSITQHIDTGLGDVRLGASISKIFEYKQQASSSSPVSPSTDIALQPADLRGRVFAGLSTGGFDGALSVNYVDDYLNPFSTPAHNVDAWTTADVALSYNFGAKGDGALGGLRLGLSVQNLFDEDPPRVASGTSGIVQPVGFDPTNANPLGRLVVVGLSKTW